MNFENEEIHLDEVIKAFHMMWDEYPSSVYLLRKNRDVVAINKAATRVGRNTGEKCYKKNGSLCSWCKAHKMIETNESLREVVKAHGLIFDSYWIPVPNTDLFVHFGNDITQWAKQELE